MFYNEFAIMILHSVEYKNNDGSHHLFSSSKSLNVSDVCRKQDNCVSSLIIF